MIVTRIICIIPFLCSFHRASNRASTAAHTWWALPTTRISCLSPSIRPTIFWKYWDEFRQESEIQGWTAGRQSSFEPTCSTSIKVGPVRIVRARVYLCQTSSSSHCWRDREFSNHRTSCCRTQWFGSLSPPEGGPSRGCQGLGHLQSE